MTEAFPLHWPAGWPRTPTHKQGKSRFTGDFARHRTALLGQLRLLGAKSVVISSNVALRNDGLPYADAAKRRISDPGVAVYFTLRGKPMVMARDLFWTPAENLRSVGLAIEHLRGLERHGGSFMMERAFDGFAALPPPNSTHWSSVLGVSRDATRSDIDAAFRRLARERHPDAGGSDAMMAELNAARATAIAEARQ